MRTCLTQSNHSSIALRLLLMLNQYTRGGRKDSREKSSQQGLTLIECLVAIMVISVTILAITPPIMLATATRIQTRRADQANQVAQGEIDRIRLYIERGGTSFTINAIPSDAGTAANPVQDISTVAAANNTVDGTNPLLSSAACSTSSNPKYPGSTPVAINKLVLVDVDGDCQPDYVMQVFRTTGYTATGSTVPSTFMVGVRVYSYPPTKNLGTLDISRSSLVAGAGNREIVNGKRRPLATLYSVMSRNDSSDSLCQMRKSTSSNPSSVTCN